MSTGEADFICNLKTCRRPIANAGWVTSCSHMFCEEDGQGRFLQDGQSKCPTCDTLLPNKFDVVYVNLNPTEEYKSMVLCGLRPEVISDIAGRAISFWAYQLFSERSNQERAARKAAEHVELMQTKHEAAMNALHVELASTLKKKEGLEKEIANLHFQVQGLRDSLADRGRQLQKAQSALTRMLRTATNKSPGRLGSTGISPSKSSLVGKFASPRVCKSPRDLFSMEQSQYEVTKTPSESRSCDAGFTFKPDVGGTCNPPLFPVTKK